MNECAECVHRVDNVCATPLNTVLIMYAEFGQVHSELASTNAPMIREKQGQRRIFGATFTELREGRRLSF